MTQQIVWIVGDWQQPDFRAASAWLNARARCAAFSTAAEAIVAVPASPAAILIFQLRPGRISHCEVEQLHAAAPLARLVALLGPWCEGELRSGQPWPGVTRIPWRTWFSRLPGELGLGSSPHDVRLPRTATEAERLTNSVASLVSRDTFGTRAEILTAGRIEFESLRDSLAVLGVNTVWRQPNQPSPNSPADLAIIDGWENVPALLNAASRSILLLHFPRSEDIDLAKSRGIAVVLAKPLLLADLAVAMDEVLPRAVAVVQESAA